MLKSEPVMTVAMPILAAISAGIGYAALYFSLPEVWSIGPIAFADLYLVFALIEAARRSRQDRGCAGGKIQSKPPVLFEFPGRGVSLLVLLFLLVSVVLGFANLYASGDCNVIHASPEFAYLRGTPPKTAPAQAAIDSTYKCMTVSGQGVEPLRGSLNSTYFSAVTLMTVGYGDFVPANEASRRLVLWEFFSGLLLLIGAFPLLASRLADF